VFDDTSVRNCDVRRLTGAGPMRIAEIETTWADEPDRREWLVIDRYDGWTGIGREHIRYDGERVSDQDSGIAITDEHIDRVIAALRAAQDGSKER